MKFTKMQGLGNDYIYINAFEEQADDLPALARRMSDRHFGVGGDGLVLIAPSDKADFRMIMYNADGSRGAMCGNASRCVAKYVYDRREDAQPDRGKWKDEDRLRGYGRADFGLRGCAVPAGTRHGETIADHGFGAHVRADARIDGQSAWRDFSG